MSAQMDPGQENGRDPETGGGSNEPIARNDPYADYNGGSPPDAPLTPGKGWEWNGSRWVQVAGRGLGYNQPAANDHAAHQNNGSPPDIPLDPGKGWEWDGTRWKQVSGRGIGYTAGPPAATGSGTGSGSGSGSGASSPAAGMSGVPATIAGPTSVTHATYTSSAPTGPVPTLADAIAAAGTMPQAPTPTAPTTIAGPAAYTPIAGPTMGATFNPGPQVGIDARNALINAILANPQTMGQTVQDQMFETQKEMQQQMGDQSRNSIAQAIAGRGFSGNGGAQLAANSGLQSDFINNLMASRRNISMEAAKTNRQDEINAVDLQGRTAAGDLAYEKNIYDTNADTLNAYNDLFLKTGIANNSGLNDWGTLNLQTGVANNEAMSGYNDDVLAALQYGQGNIGLALGALMGSRQQGVAEDANLFSQWLGQQNLNANLDDTANDNAFNWSNFSWQQYMDMLNAQNQ